MGTKIHLLTDSQGKPLRFLLTGSQRNDCTQAKRLLAGFTAQAVIADKGYDVDGIVRMIQQKMKAIAVIPPRIHRKHPLSYDIRLYKHRNLIERSINRLKQFRRIATRYDRKALYFLSALQLVSFAIWG